MKKFITLIILLHLSSMIVSGCQSVSLDSTLSTQTPSLTPGVVPQKGTVTPGEQKPVFLVTKSPVSETPGSSIGSSPESTEDETGPSVFDSLNCGEVFCSTAWPGFLSRPIGESYRNTIDLTYPYASTRNGTLEVHTGVEFVNSSGTPVIAAGNGEVVFAGVDDQTLVGPYYGFFGNVVVIKHPDLFQGMDVFSLYGHLSEISVEAGDRLQAGDLVGKVGATGYAEGSHLHFEVRIGENDDDHTVNPILWFSSRPSSSSEAQAILAGQIIDQQGNPISKLSLALERLDEEGKILEYFYLNTYEGSTINSHPELNENFAIPDIPPGDYRMAFVYGRLYELFFTLEPGELGLIRFQVD
jgi:murein DD-endopeptidase MepM/ murein hydrolase activator NlpD